jgi:L-lactate utilization protein LutB
MHKQGGKSLPLQQFLFREETVKKGQKTKILNAFKILLEEYFAAVAEILKEYGHLENWIDDLEKEKKERLATFITYLEEK